jgi:hypothetical protein
MTAPLTTAPAPGLPPFSQVLKSREVEDPVNLWVHRPLAYAFCWAVFRTPVTPNQVTLFAILLGLAAAGCWVEGSPAAMVWGGALLWSSAIMDGADGILARAKNLQSAFGRALDGSADMIVGLATVAACIYHLAVQGAGFTTFAFAALAVLTTVWQLNLYDFYKELHLRQTRLDRGGESDSADEVVVLRDSDTVKRSPWYTRLSMRLYADYLAFQESLIERTNPGAKRLLTGVARSEQSAQIYRRHNRGPMRLWMAVSLAPHSYLFAIFAMFDRLDLYLFTRLGVMGAIMVAAIVTQRRATARTVAAFEQSSFLAPLAAA